MKHTAEKSRGGKRSSWTWSLRRRSAQRASWRTGRSSKKRASARGRIRRRATPTRGWSWRRSGREDWIFKQVKIWEFVYWRSSLLYIYIHNDPLYRRKSTIYRAKYLNIFFYSGGGRTRPPPQLHEATIHLKVRKNIRIVSFKQVMIKFRHSASSPLNQVRKGSDRNKLRH